MQEMWDGKLQSTLRSFVKKVMVDMSLRPRLEGNLPQPSSKLGHLLRSRAAIFAQIHALGAKDDVAATASPSKRGDEKLADFMASWRVVPATPAWVVWKDELELAKCGSGCVADTFCFNANCTTFRVPLQLSDR